MINTSLFMTVWPWIGLGAAVVILLLLFTTNWLQNDKSIPRWKDPTWFAWFAAIAYMLHNVEEYGIDATLTTMAFPAMMQNQMHVVPPESFFLMVNLSLVWLAGPLAAIFSRKYPVLVLAMPTIQLINCFLHIPGAIALKFIGAGLVTAITLFIPIAVWAYVGFCGKYGFKKIWFLKFVAIAVVYHLGFVATIIPILSGNSPVYLPALTMGTFTILTLALWYLMGKHTIKQN
jgi:hypothetical protein